MTASAKSDAYNILILGNLGYIGPVLGAHLRAIWPNARLIGYDSGFFQGCLLDPQTPAERYLDTQYYGDVRHVPDHLFEGIDGVVALAAVSNDPMGKRYEAPTQAINADALVALAAKAKAAGVKRFVLASSCSVYGAGGEGAKNEQSELNPLTAYARSKIACENGLKPLASAEFIVTALRFATACGASPRLRLDLVLNDFVASALVNRHIEILSDGTPWRPLIHVGDMSRAIEWALTRAQASGTAFLTVNAGSDAWNFTVRGLADAVAGQIGDVTVSLNADAPPDKRSYRVDFALFRALAPAHQPLKTLPEAIAGLVESFTHSGFNSPKFRDSHLIRFNTLNALQQRGAIDESLYWK